MRINEIQDLIKFVSKSGVSEVNLETDKLKLTIKNGPKKGKGQTEFVEQQVVPMMMPQVQPAVQQVAPAPAPAPVAAPAPAAEKAAPAPAAEDDSKFITIKSPMIGTFYRRPSPDKDLFVNVGDEIKQGDVICVIEAMKLFNEIESEVAGKIVKVLVEDASPVEYDQPLFLVDPS